MERNIGLVFILGGLAFFVLYVGLGRGILVLIDTEENTRACKELLEKMAEK